MLYVQNKKGKPKQREGASSSRISAKGRAECPPKVPSQVFQGGLPSSFLRSSHARTIVVALPLLPEPPGLRRVVITDGSGPRSGCGPGIDGYPGAAGRSRHWNSLSRET